MGRPGRAAAAVRAGEAREMRTSTWLPPRSSVTLQTSSPSVSSGSASSTRLRTCLRRRLIARARSERERCASLRRVRGQEGIAELGRWRNHSSPAPRSRRVSRDSSEPWVRPPVPFPNPCDSPSMRRQPFASRGVPSARPAPGPSLGPVLVKHHLTARPKNHAPRADKYAAPETKEEMYVPMKVVVVGDGAVGKTSMLLCYTTNTFPTDYMATVFDNYAVNVPYGDKVVSLGLWDTAGQEEYAQYRPLSYDKADGFILAFDLTSRPSMENVSKRWIKELRAKAPGAPVVLVGTKLDLRVGGSAHQGHGSACVAAREGEALGKRIGAECYVECSALTQDNLGAVFDAAVDACMRRREATKKRNESNGRGARGRSGCCAVS